MLLPGAAFTALLLLISGVSAATVPPPTNVTVSCRNVNPTVSWEYGKKQPLTSFRVSTKGPAGNYYESETTDHQYDLSHYVWISEEHYMALFYVTVTAIQGGSQSEAVPSNTFSYNYVKTVDTACALDFPPVHVNVDESRGTVSFQNPFHFYKELRQTIRPESTSEFIFTASPVTLGTTHVGKFDESCTVKETICKVDVEFSEGEETCVTLKGLLFDGMGVQQVVFRETARICPPDSVEVHVIILAVVLLSALFLIIALVVILMCKARAWTMKTPKLPNSLLPTHREQALKYDTVPRTDISAVTACKPQSLSVGPEDDAPSESLQDRTDDGPRARSLDTQRRLSDSSNRELISEGNGTGSDSADDSVKTECVSTDSEEEETELVSPYDCPHTLRLDMGDGDIVTGYTGE